MNGPQHFRQAEDQLAQAEALLDQAASGLVASDVVVHLLAAANVHATLAAAAAFALPHVVRMRVGTDEWADTLGIDLAEVTGL
ncbi:hypothetical protein GCM10027047_01400 [Rhodococcus aerolatus]